MAVLNKKFKESAPKKPYVNIPYIVLDQGLKPRSLALMICLLRQKNGYRLSQDQIKRETGLGRKGLKAAIEDLVDRNIIKYEAGSIKGSAKQVSRYDVQPVDFWRKNVEAIIKDTSKVEEFMNKIEPYLGLTGEISFQVIEIIENNSSFKKALTTIGVLAVHSWKDRMIKSHGSPVQIEAVESIGKVAEEFAETFQEDKVSL